VKPRSRRRRKYTEWMFGALFIASIVIALGTLAYLLGTIVSEASPALRPSILTNWASRDPSRAGYAAAIVGTIWIVGLTMLFSLPLGIAAGIYLQEYAPPNRFTRLLQAGVTNLAGVPSVVFGLLGLAFFSRALGLGFSVLAAALTLTVLVFPYVVATTQEAVRAVPQSIREGALALGATKWQSIFRQVLPAGAPGLLTASILAASRAMGETAPLIVLSSVVFMTFLPGGLDSPFVVLPVQIYGYIGLPQEEFRHVAAAGSVILVGLLLSFNSVAIFFRNRMQRRRW